MIAAYVVGGIVVWAAIAFGLAALFRPRDGDRHDAHWVAWVTGLWPISIPLIIALGLPLLVICGMVWAMIEGGNVIGDAGAYYIDFLTGEKTVQARREKRAKEKQENGGF